MAGRVEHAQGTRAELERFAAAKGGNAFGGHRQHWPPQRVHCIAIQPLGAAQQFGWIGQVRRATLVHIDLQVREAPQQLARRASVVEMNVCQHDGVQPAEWHASGGQASLHGFERAGRAGVNDRGRVAVQQVGGDHMRAAKVHVVNDRNIGRKRGHSSRFRLRAQAQAPGSSYHRRVRTNT